jgi:hypothetical protein
VEQEAHPSSSLAQHQQQVAGLLGDPRPVRSAVTPPRWTERVSCSMNNSTHSRRSQMVSTVKQVAGHDPRSLLAQERRPGRTGPSRCRVEPVATERGADHGRGGPHAKPEQLTLDPLVAPGGVLPGQADDQLLHLWVQGRSSCLAVRVGPRAGHQPPVPVQQRLRLDQEARPSGPGQDAAGCGEQGAVGGLELRTWGLAALNGELLAQDQDLQVLGGVTASKQREQLDGASQREVGEFRQHPGWPPRSGSRSATLPSRGSNELAAHDHVRLCAPFRTGRTLHHAPSSAAVGR